MNGDDKLSDRLKRMRVPASPNPRHEAALRMELERLAAQPAVSPLPGASRNQRPDDPARGRTIRGVFARPALPVMGAVAAVVIGIFFFTQSPPSAPAELARGAAAGLVVMQAGAAAVKSGTSFLEAGLPLDGWGTFLKPGGKYEMSLSLSLQKYGRLRVVSDRTETVLVGF